MPIYNEDYIKKYEPLWGGWYIDGLIGEGSFGKVYKISKEEWGFKYESALKLICIPTKEQYREAVSALNGSGSTLAGYFEDAVKSIVNEIRLMYTLRGNSNIISYEDHIVESRDIEPGWDILIRMEYAPSLIKHMQAHEMSRQDILKLGIDICSALEACSKIGIIHRDIKDENIFVSPNGSFKIGDFGISRELSKSGKAASMKGTPFFMAPEVYRGEKYDGRADIYSLGIVLYKLLNHGRLPFLPPYPQDVRYRDTEISLNKRIAGEQFTPPLKANEELGRIVLKACSFNIAKRYPAALEMRKALENVSGKLSASEKTEVLIVPEYKSNNIRDESSLEGKPVNTGYANTVLDATVLIDPGRRPEAEYNANTCIEPKNDAANAGIVHGNPAGNITNGGIAACEGLWVYYSSMGGSRKLYKSRLDGTERSKLSDDNAWFINVSDCWLYYSNSSDDDKLYRINIDGSKRTKLSNDKAWYINVAGGWICYSNESDGYGLYKVRTDGSGKIKLSDDSSHCLNVAGNWVYYCNKSDKGRIYKITTDGKSRAPLNVVESACINVCGDQIYYCNKSDGHKLYRISIYGSGNEMLNKNICHNINVSGSWIYYCNKSKGSIICKFKTDGSAEYAVNNYNSDYINIIDDYIFYCNSQDGERLYKMALDGSGNMAFGPDNPADTEDHDNWFIL